MSSSPATPINECTAKLTPLSSGKKKARALHFKNNDGNKTVHVIHVRPGKSDDNSVDRLIILNHGFSDKVVSGVLFMKADNPLKVMFINSIDCLNKVVSIKSIVADPSAFSKPDSGHNLRAVVILNDCDAEEEACRFVNGHHNICVKHLLPKSINTLLEQQRPKMHPDKDCSVVQSWSAILTNDDCQFVVSHKTKDCDGARAWFHKNNADVCTPVLPVGEVPLTVIHKCALNQNQLDPVDWQCHIACEQEQAETVANVMVDIEAEKEETSQVSMPSTA